VLFTVHDTAYFPRPATAVSRITLMPWAAQRQKGTPPLATCLSESLHRVEKAAPDFAHGLLIHGIQKRENARTTNPNIQTLRQYLSSYTPFQALTLADHPRVAPSRIVVYRECYTPPWLWYSLCARLLLESHVVGEAPV
jgi:hypothetical protein